MNPKMSNLLIYSYVILYQLKRFMPIEFSNK